MPIYLLIACNYFVVLCLFKKTTEKNLKTSNIYDLIQINVQLEQLGLA